MATTVTIKGQITLPKSVREATGIKPGVRVEIVATASGDAVIKKVAAPSDFRSRILAVAKRRVVRGITSDELMDISRGEIPARKRNRK